MESPETTGTNFIVIGTCEDMCPEKERQIRENERLIHKFEVLSGTENQRYPRADATKTVKSFSRCAAGQQTPRPSDLRTLPTLKMTVSYLIKEVATIENIDWSLVYDYVFDRLCAVRQDLVFQNFNSEESLSILETIIRFLVYAGYRLCEEPLEKYNATINFLHMTNCLKKVLTIYDSVAWEESKSVNLDSRTEMEALYQLAFLGKAESLNRGLQLEKKFRTPVVNTALEMSLAHFNGNYVHTSKQILKLPPLLACAAYMHVPTIRRNALAVMSVAFSSQVLFYPAEDLQSILMYPNVKEVLEDCRHYGFATEDERIFFQKGKFSSNAKMTTLCRHPYIDASVAKTKLPSLLFRDELEGISEKLHRLSV